MGKGNGKGKRDDKPKASHSWPMDIQNKSVGSLPSQPKPWANRPQAFSDGQSASSTKVEQKEDGMGEVTPRTTESDKQLVVEAVKSLYYDQMKPYLTHVLRRSEEMSGQRRWRPQQLQQLCKSIPAITMVDDYECIAIMLHESPEGFEGFVDCLAEEDPFPAHVWFEVKNFIQQQQAGCTNLPRCRYELAKWMRDRVKGLAEYSLGCVCHLVQLSISRRELLGYHQGNLVPYHFSDNSKKKSHALLQMPMLIQPGESYVQTWEEAGNAIAHVLQQNRGPVKLSQLKSMCRKTCQMELSESALGHSKLSEFLHDPRLKASSGGSFAVEVQNGQRMVVHRVLSRTSSAGIISSEQQQPE
jgi:hypothetical protein